MVFLSFIKTCGFLILHNPSQTTMYSSRGVVRIFIRNNNIGLGLAARRGLVTIPTITNFKRQRICNVNDNNNTSFILNRCQIRYNSITSSTDGSNIPTDVQNLTVEEYHQVSDSAFETMLDELDLFFEENKIMEAEIDEEAGVMEINCSEGTYIINKQPPTKQIWLSSPISGPKRFDLHNGQWICLRDNVKLSQLLQDEMNQMYGGFAWSNPF